MLFSVIFYRRVRTPTSDKAMNTRLNLVKQCVKIDCAWVTVLSDEKIPNLLHSKQSKTKFWNYCNNAFTTIITRSKMKLWIAQEANGNPAGLTQVEDETLI